MNRRTLASSMAVLPLAGFFSRAHANPTRQCVFMEEREGAFVLEGVGAMLTEPFPLEEGTYRIEIEIPEPRPKSWFIEIQFYIREDGGKWRDKSSPWTRISPILIG